MFNWVKSHHVTLLITQKYNPLLSKVITLKFSNAYIGFLERNHLDTSLVITLVWWTLMKYCQII